MPALPWENGTFMPWMVGQVFIGPDGWAYQVYQDQTGVGQATGYVVKRFNPNNPSEVTYSAGQAPIDSQAYANWYEGTPQARQQKAYEEAIIARSQWEQDQAEAKLDLDRERLRQEWSIAQMNAKSQEERDKVDAWYKYNLVQNARLQLGASLRGPENHFFYQEAAARGRANPITNGVASWFDPQSNQATGTGAWGGGEANRGTLGSLGAAFGAGDTNWFGDSGTNNAVSGNGQDDQATLSAMDQFFKNPHKAAPGFLESRNDTQIALMKGAADYLGHDWNTVVSRYAISRPNQRIGDTNRL